MPKVGWHQKSLGLLKGEAHTYTLSFSGQLQDCHPKARVMYDRIICFPSKLKKLSTML